MDEKPKGSILMVEDERFFFLPLRDMLEARGYVISWASNATEAYQQLIEQGPTLDAVLLDLMLPLRGCLGNRVWIGSDSVSEKR